MPMYFQPNDLLFQTQSGATAIGGAKTQVITVAFRVRGAEEISSSDRIEIGDIVMTTISLSGMYTGGVSASYESLYDSVDTLADEKTEVMTVINRMRLSERFRSYELTRDIVTLAIRHYASETDLLIVNAETELRAYLERCGFAPVENRQYVAINRRVTPLISDYDARYVSSMGSSFMKR